jgi:hypothetical protein
MKCVAAMTGDIMEFQTTGRRTRGRRTRHYKRYSRHVAESVRMGRRNPESSTVVLNVTPCRVVEIY